MEKQSYCAQPTPTQITSPNENPQKMDVSKFTRQEILDNINFLAKNILKTEDSEVVSDQRRALAELLLALDLDYTTPEYYEQLQQIAQEQKMVDKLADIVAVRLQGNADTTDKLSIENIRNASLEQALYIAAVTLVRNGQPADDLSTIIRNT